MIEHSLPDHPPEAEEARQCFNCLEDWEFLGSLDHDGEEVIEGIRCRRCGGTGWLVEEVRP